MVEKVREVNRCGEDQAEEEAAPYSNSSSGNQSSPASESETTLTTSQRRIQSQDVNTSHQDVNTSHQAPPPNTNTPRITFHMELGGDGKRHPNHSQLPHLLQCILGCVYSVYLGRSCPLTRSSISGTLIFQMQLLWSSCPPSRCACIPYTLTFQMRLEAYEA